MGAKVPGGCPVPCLFGSPLAPELFFVAQHVVVGAFTVPAFSFCLVEREIGAADQPLEIVGMPGESGHPEADGSLDLEPLVNEGSFFEEQPKPPAEYHGVFQRSFGKSDDEFLPPIAPHEIRGTKRLSEHPS